MRTLTGVDIVRDNLAPPGLRGAVARATGEDGDPIPRPLMFVNFSVFGVWYEVNSFWEGTFMESTAPGSFKKTFKERAGQIKVLFNHGHDMQIGNKVLGPIRRLEETTIGPESDVELLDTTYNADLIPGLDAALYGSSFRFQVIKDAWDDEPGPSDTNPKGLPERTIHEVRLFEFGPVTFPANPEATAGIRSATDQFYDRCERDNPGVKAMLARARQHREPVTHSRTSAQTRAATIKRGI